jgi:thioredoxin-dependent peroxiredoxin
VKAFSDHRDASFGNAYGVLIKELRLLARSIFIVDKDDVIRYIQIVPEVTNELDYERVLGELKKIVG